MKLLNVTGLVCALLASGCREEAPSPGPEQAAESVLGEYRNYTKMTAKPHEVNLNMLTYCVGASESMVREAEKDHGPHTFASIVVYMNQAAEGAFHQKTDFPEGATIVKEKIRHSYRAEKDPGKWIQPNDGIGGMIKGAPGSSPSSGDWTFFYSEDDKILESGAISTCASCHETAAESDWVYGGWFVSKQSPVE